MKKFEPTHWYLEIAVEHEDVKDMSAEMLQVFMRDAVLKMFGESAASLPIDVLAFHPHLHQAVIRVPSENYSRVRGALTMSGKDGAMGFSVCRASPCLIALAGPQRTIA